MASHPILTCVVPTIGRPSLARTLASIRGQAPAREVEIIVVGDVHAGTWRTPLAAVPAVCAEYQARYTEFDGGLHMVGQPQRQAGMEQARGQWLAFSQDDAVWRPEAWAAIRASVLDGEPCPRLFRVQVQPAFTVWLQAGRLAEGEIDADGLCLPNDPWRLGQWGLRHSGDYDMAAETVNLWGGLARWEEMVIAEGRP